MLGVVVGLEHDEAFPAHCPIVSALEDRQPYRPGSSWRDLSGVRYVIGRRNLLRGMKTDVLNVFDTHLQCWRNA